MRVLFAGASGILGRALVPQLLAAGHDVIALTRSPAAADRLTGSGADAVVARALDREELLAALRGIRADAVLHELTALTKPPTRYRAMRMTNALRTLGTANLLDAADAVGATRFVTQSIVFGYGYRAHPATIDESAPFGEPDGTPVDPTSEALAENERRVFESGLDGIALRYGLFYGGDAETVRGMLHRRMLPAVAGWNGSVPLIHHEDAARATVTALEDGRPGTAYNVADDDPSQSWASYVDAAAEAWEEPRPPRVPGAVLRVAAPYAARLMGGMDLRVATHRIRSLGWTPRYPSAREGWRAVASR